MELQGKGKDDFVEEDCIEKTQGKKKSTNSRLKAIYIIGQRKAFSQQTIPKSIYATKETGHIEIFITSTKGVAI